jgi:hypothetical protein
MTVSKEDLLRQRFGVTDYEIPGVGVVQVRALTHGEALQVAGVETDRRELEAKVLSWAMMAPSLTEAEALVWIDNSPAGELTDLVKFVQELSGLGEGAAKSGVSGVRE